MYQRGFLINDKLEARIKVVHDEIDTMNEHGNWTSEMEVKELELYKQSDYLLALRMRYDAIFND